MTNNRQPRHHHPRGPFTTALTALLLTALLIAVPYLIFLL